MNLSTATPQDIADFNIDGSGPGALALYFHTRALAAKLAHQGEHFSILRSASPLEPNDTLGLTSLDQSCCAEFTARMTKYLESFSATFTAWENFADDSLGPTLVTTLQAIVLHFDIDFPTDVSFAFEIALGKLRGWKREEEAEHGSIAVFGSEYPGASA